MITREILSELLSFDPEQYLTTTLYLPIDGSITPAYVITLKDFIKERKKELEEQNLDPAIVESVHTDFKKMKDFVELQFSREGVRTLILFSCSAKNWWKVLTVSLPLRTLLVVQKKPYLRPLTYLLDEYRRFLVILIERSRARFFQVYAGEIVEHPELTDDIPRKTREGGYLGYEEKRIHRHIEDHVRRHFKHAADVAYELSRRFEVDAVILGGVEQNTNEFQHYLHKALQDRLMGRVALDIFASHKDVLETTSSVEKNLRLSEEKKMLTTFFDQVKSGGLGIVGLDSTIRALQRGQVNYILVQEGYSTKGYRCRECKSLQAHNGLCDSCGGQQEEVPDVVDEVLLQATEQGCQIKYITLPDSELVRAGRIGAMLRFKA